MKNGRFHANFTMLAGAADISLLFFLLRFPCFWGSFLVHGVEGSVQRNIQGNVKF